MTERVFFVVERSSNKAGQCAILYYDILPDRLTRKIPRDDRKQPCEPNPIIYALRLDKLAEGDPWRTRSLAENYAAYRLAVIDKTPLPPGNLAEPPKPKEKTGTLYTPPGLSSLPLLPAAPPPPSRPTLVVVNEDQP